MKKPAIVRAATILILLVSCARAQQSRPLFSGTWKLVPQLSKFGPFSDRAIDVYKLKSAGTKLEIVHLRNGTRQSLPLILDGKERSVLPASGVSSARAYWDADTIVVEKRQAVAGNTQVWTTRYSLSADGNRLTMQHHVQESPLSPAFDEERVYERR
jgi:hypothetical protein